VISVKALYYDGKSSVQTPVELVFYESGKVLIRSDASQWDSTVDRLSIAARLGNTRRNIFLSDGSKIETDDNEAIDRVCRYFNKNRPQSLLHSLEKNRTYVLAALLLTAATIWAGIEFGVPLAAKTVANSLPAHVEHKIGKEALIKLDDWLFSESTIGKGTQAELNRQLQQLTAHTLREHLYRLLFRNSTKMGANALAIPGGDIILTDDLLDLAENNEQILAVLAHEIGHIEHKHGLRSLLQNSLTALFMAGLLGDIASVTSLSVALPTVLVETRYSRQFELEADRYAVELLDKQNIPIEHFTRILTLLEQSHGLNPEFDYLSSHPATDKRIGTIYDRRK